MLEHSQLEASARTERGKNAARRLRVAGQVPATVYGLGQEPVAISLNTKEMVNHLNDRSGRNRVFELTGGAEGPTMAVDWQSDPVTGKLLHVDMRRVDMDTRVKLKVPVNVTGEAYGVKTEGGILDVVLREIAIICLPNDVPETIELDITDLRVGDSVRVTDLVDGDKYATTSNADMIVLRLVGRKSEEEEVADEEAAALAGEEAAASVEGEGEGEGDGEKS